MSKSSIELGTGLAGDGFKFVIQSSSSLKDKIDISSIDKPNVTMIERMSNCF
jgi:AICAR transformylase/IMP cyclohydrolase PurH